MCKITYYYGQWTACNVDHYDYEEEARVKVLILILPPGDNSIKNWSLKTCLLILSKLISTDEIASLKRRPLSWTIHCSFFFKHNLHLVASFVALCQLWADSTIQSFTTAHKNQKFCGIIKVQIASPEAHPSYPSTACWHYHTKLHIRSNPINRHLLEKLTFAQLINKFPIFCGIEISLLTTKRPSAGPPYHLPYRFIPHLHIVLSLTEIQAYWPFTYGSSKWSSYLPTFQLKFCMQFSHILSSFRALMSRILPATPTSPNSSIDTAVAILLIQP